MITLEGIKALLVIAGLNYLRLDFDDEQKHVKAYYVFKGESGIKQITYQEIIDSLTIGSSDITQCHTVASECSAVDSNKQLRQL